MLYCRRVPRMNGLHVRCFTQTMWYHHPTSSTTSTTPRRLASSPKTTLRTTDSSLRHLLASSMAMGWSSLGGVFVGWQPPPALPLYIITTAHTDEGSSGPHKVSETIYSAKVYSHSTAPERRTKKPCNGVLNWDTRSSGDDIATTFFLKMRTG